MYQKHYLLVKAQEKERETDVLKEMETEMKTKQRRQSREEQRKLIIQARRK